MCIPFIGEMQDFISFFYSLLNSIHLLKVLPPTFIKQQMEHLWGAIHSWYGLLYYCSLSHSCHHLEYLIPGAHLSLQMADLDIPIHFLLMDLEWVITMTAALNKYFTKELIDIYSSLMICYEENMKCILNIYGYYDMPNMCLPMHY